ncbi:MAG: ATP-grasp domain-containing protein [Actinomycetota bacterium]|nr:ATP-grasp domain-containing protein [Actinomycetota bacterium]
MAVLASEVHSGQPLAAAQPPHGALVLGGDYRALGVVRSLGRRGVPVWVVREGDDQLAARSRYARRRVPWTAGGEAAGVMRLLQIADDGARGFALIPSSDGTAALVARHHALLSEHFVVTVPRWATMRRAYDKRLMHLLAAELGLDTPHTALPRHRRDVEALELDFPAILKPAIKEHFNRLTAAKAWRVDNREELLAGYEQACTLVAPDILMVQELIPGGGEAQLSFTALCEQGRVLAGLTARRTRQYPVDVGRASTYVETIDCPEIVGPSHALLSALGWTGLVEVEYKRDPRDGRCKLLDVNPRVWGWHTLCARAGVDFPYLLWRALRGETISSVASRSGVRWVRTTTDLPMVAREILARRMRPAAYVRSLRGPLEGAIFARDDPAPAIHEVPQLVSILARRLVRGDGL